MLVNTDHPVFTPPWLTLTHPHTFSTMMELVKSHKLQTQTAPGAPLCVGSLETPGVSCRL